MRSAKVSCRHFANPAENLDSNMSASSTLSRSCRLRCSCQVYFAKELGWGSEARQTLWHSRNTRMTIFMRPPSVCDRPAKANGVLEQPGGMVDQVSAVPQLPSVSPVAEGSQDGRQFQQAYLDAEIGRHALHVIHEILHVGVQRPCHEKSRPHEGHALGALKRGQNMAMQICFCGPPSSRYL